MPGSYFRIARPVWLCGHPWAQRASSQWEAQHGRNRVGALCAGRFADQSNGRSGVPDRAFEAHFTQPQLLAILCLVRCEDWMFRETEVRLAEHRELRAALRLKRIPDCTTLYRSMRRLSLEVLDRVLAATLREQPDLAQAGLFHLCRSGQRLRRPALYSLANKLSSCHSSTYSSGLECRRCYTRPAWQSSWRIQGVRAQLRKRFPRHKYGQRALIESALSAVKRKLSARAPGCSTETQRLPALLLGLAYNLHRPGLLEDVNRAK